LSIRPSLAKKARLTTVRAAGSNLIDPKHIVADKDCIETGSQFSQDPRPFSGGAGRQSFGTRSVRRCSPVRHTLGAAPLRVERSVVCSIAPGRDSDRLFCASLQETGYGSTRVRADRRGETTTAREG
jgi:hypothetical protein